MLNKTTESTMATGVRFDEVKKKAVRLLRARIETLDEWVGAAEKHIGELELVGLEHPEMSEQCEEMIGDINNRIDGLERRRARFELMLKQALLTETVDA